MKKIVALMAMAAALSGCFTLPTPEPYIEYTFASTKPQYALDYDRDQCEKHETMKATVACMKRHGNVLVAQQPFKP